MRVIITGGSGLIGRALTAELIAGGHEVVILSRNPDRVEKPPAGATLTRWDAATAAGWSHLVNGQTAIVNLAGANIAGSGFFPARWTEAKKRLIVESRRKAGEAVVAAVAAAEEKPQVVLQISGVGYYGVENGDLALTESAPAGNDFLAQTCIIWEQASAPVKEFGVRHVVTRTGIVLSTQEGALARTMVPYKFFAGGPFGAGRQWWSWIHLEDAVRGLQFLLENEATSGVFNLTSPNPLRNKEFGKKLGQVMGRPSLFPVPGFAMQALFGEVAIVVLEGQKVLPVCLNEAGFHFKFPEAKKAFRDLIQRRI